MPVCSALLGVLLLAQVPPFAADFERVMVSSGRPDTTRGRIYFVAPWRVHYDVSYPLRQQLSVVKGAITIYYPDDGSAFRITAESPFENPFSGHSLPVIDPAQMMPKLGFRLTETRIAADTSFDVWKPANPARLPFGSVVFGRVGSLPVLVEVTRRAGRPSMRTTFDSHQQLDSIWFPTRVTNEQFLEDGTTETETMTYTRLDTCPAFLDSIRRFSLPLSARARRISW